MKRSVTTWVVTCTSDSSGEMSKSEPGLLFLIFLFSLNCCAFVSHSLLLCLSAQALVFRLKVFRFAQKLVSHDNLPNFLLIMLEKKKKNQKPSTHI